MNGLLVYLGGQDPRLAYQLQTLTEAFAKLRIKMIAVPSQDITRLLETTKKGFFKLALLLTNDVQVAKYLETEQQIKVFNDASTINLCLDRALLSITLRNAGIASPETIALPYVVNVNVMQTISDVKAMMQQLRYPVLIKNRYPQFNEKIYFARDEKELIKILPPIGMQPLIIQAYVPQENRQLFKVLIVGKKALAGVEVVQENGKEFLKQNPLPSSVKKIAIQAAKTIGATYSLVSVFYLENTKPYVYSVKSNPNIVELQIATGIYLSWYLAKHIASKLK
ncbi:MAG: ATP-grasp domain-containing protein [Bacilli bacterium]